MEYDLIESNCDGRRREVNVSVEQQQQQQQQQHHHQQQHQHPTRLCSDSHYLRTSIVTSCMDLVDSGPKLQPADVTSKLLSAQVMEYCHKYTQSSNLEQYFSLPTSSNYYHTLYETNPNLTVEQRANYIAENYTLKTPKERRRWERPPLIGESVNVDSSSISATCYVSKSLSPESKIFDDKIESQEFDKKPVSPTSSVASHKPLEWDSLADVGYCNVVPYNKSVSKRLSTIERMVLNKGCSSALRLDPEGTEPTSQINPNRRGLLKPKGNSTPLSRNISETDSEIEITPIVKSHVKTITKPPCETIIFITPSQDSGKSTDAKDSTPSEPKLKKSPSMNFITPLNNEVGLKRSQSELNLCAKDKYKILPRLIFNSTSSIATVVNKITCDKVIQTCADENVQVQSESIGVQVSGLDDEKLPKNNTSKLPQSILKSSKNTYKVRAKGSPQRAEEKQSTKKKSGKKCQSSATSIDSMTSTPQPEDTTENVAGRANSFEYFPGNVYENGPSEKNSSRVSSRVSSVATSNSHSTMPNTSSSLEEKLWGQSDSLLRDLEKGLKILQNLVSTNKCDKQTRQRFIHHMVTRLVSANYSDDKIEHNLEENIPWNPDDARKKVYRAEMIHNLAKKRNTTDSSDDWKPRIRKRESKKSSDPIRELPKSDNQQMKKIITGESSSDKFDRNTDRTETDGRKARMGLRTDDECYRDKSESSECFLPQRIYNKINQMKSIYALKKKCERKESTSNSTSNQGSDLLNDIVSRTQSSANSSNGVDTWKSPLETSEPNFHTRKENTDTESENIKLINYAEMEKKNQLVWITNEISHLKNLKKLLEEPKKSTPSKSLAKSKPDVKEKEVNTSTQTNKHTRNISDIFEHQIHKQWSSHCDLTACEPIASSSLKSVKCVRKRNSYTQTDSNIDCSHSKSGAEIISAQKVSTQYVKITNTSAQTSPLSSIRNTQVTNTACQTQSCSQSTSDKFKSCSKSCSCFSSDNEKTITNHCHGICRSKNDEHLKLKDAKNHMNSNKVKKNAEIAQICCHCERQNREKACVCACANNCKCCSRSNASDMGKDNDYDDDNNDDDEYSSKKHCRTCGTTYQNNRGCHCVMNYPKPVAYEIKFGDNKKVKEDFKTMNREAKKLRSGGTSNNVSGCVCNNVQSSKNKENQGKKEKLSDYLSFNKPKFVNNVETRQKYISEISHLRQLKKEKQLQLLAMSNTATLLKSFKSQKKPNYIQKKYTEEQLKELSRQRYYRLNEIRAKREQKAKEEAFRHNKLMAQLFCKKLQQKVLRGQVDLSQSTSVISNL